MYPIPKNLCICTFFHLKGTWNFKIKETVRWYLSHHWKKNHPQIQSVWICSLKYHDCPVDLATIKRGVGVGHQLRSLTTAYFRRMKQIEGIIRQSIGWICIQILVLCERAGINELVPLITGTSPLYSVRGRLTCMSDPGDKIWQGEKIPYKPINHGNREYANFNNVLYSSKLARE